MLQIAKVLNSNGIDGDLLIGFRDIDIEDIDQQEPVFINFDGLPVPFFIESIRKKGNGKAIVHLTDIDSLRDAEEVVGSEVFADWELEEEEGDDFIGWTVFDHGRNAGVVADIEPIPGNPCLYVDTPDQGQVLIPLHEDFIAAADPDARELHLNLPEGLL